MTVKCAMYTVISASPMQELKFKTAAKGMRTYLLVKGGIDVPKIMGSSSTSVTVNSAVITDVH